MGKLLGIFALVMSLASVGWGWDSRADIIADGRVDYDDLRMLIAGWLGTAAQAAEDVDGDGAVTAKDFAILARNWFSENLELRGALEHALDFSAGRLATTAGVVSSSKYPNYTDQYTSWRLTDMKGWTSGFYPGCLWLMYEMDGRPDMLGWAQAWTAGLASQAFNTATNDIGFMIMCSYGNGYRLTANVAYKNTILTAAQTLSGRYSTVVGCVKASDTYHFPVNIDTMMNMELLFWAAANGGQSQWREMAMSHAHHVRRDLIRADGSSYQFVDYDPASGAVLSKFTRQGYGTETTWSRGQGWAIYGFTMAYRYTGEPNFLETAKRSANYYITHMPADGVAYWDFNAPGIPNTERDTSAASIATAGLLELSGYVNDAYLKKKYFDTACIIMGSLCQRVSNGGYLAQNAAGDATSPGILMHGCYVNPQSVIHGTSPDASLIYGDYYLLEAVNRMLRALQ